VVDAAPASLPAISSSFSTTEFGHEDRGYLILKEVPWRKEGVVGRFRMEKGGRG
jgi:hypothetical protein